MITPRDYQAKIDADIEAGWEDASKQLVIEPTGCGKTIQFALQCLRRIKEGKRTLILAHRDELLDQAISKIERVTGLRADKEKADSFASLNSPVVVGSIQTLMREGRLNRWPKDHFAEVVVDETHRALAKSYQVVLRHFDDEANILGVTATPQRSDKKNLGQYFEKIAVELKLVEMIHAGWLVPIVFHRLPIAIDLSNVKTSQTEYGEDIGREAAADAITPYLHKIAESVREHAGFRRSLGFAPLVETARKAAQACRDVGLSAEYVHGEDDERKEKLERFRNGEFDILWNADLLTEGYDDPGISTIVNASPTQSVGKYWQMNGRGTRCVANVDVFSTPEERRLAIAQSEKPDLLILDFLYHNHPVCTPASLIASTQEEADVIMQMATSGKMFSAEQVDLLAAGEKSKLAREETLRKKLEKNKGRKKELLTAEEFAFWHGGADVAEYEPTMQWEMAKPSDRQMKYLKQAKIDPETITCKGQASKLLDLCFKDVKKPKLASEGAVSLMRKMQHVCRSIGITDFDNVTQAQAGRFFAALKEKKRQPNLV